MNKLKNLKKGYSLLEMVITLVIVNIVLLMLSNILVISLRIASQAQSRAEAREEIASTLSLIKRDIRNASSLEDNCKGEPTGGNFQNSASFCTMSTGSYEIDWTLCANERDPEGYSVCKYVDGVNNYRSAANLIIDDLQIVQAGTDIAGNDQISILITIVGHHVNDDEDDPTMFRQEIVSTRNYRI